MKMIKKAIRLAIEAHQNQKRKGSDLPYIEHPIHVGMLLIKANQTDHVVVAGILHDTLEDTTVTEEQLRSEFGEEVLFLVQAASEPEKDLPWKERKQHTIEHIKESSQEAQMIILCDKLSNIMDMEADLLVHGDALWGIFNAGYEDQKWYYDSLAEALENLNDIDLYQDFSQRVMLIFK